MAGSQMRMCRSKSAAIPLPKPYADTRFLRVVGTPRGSGYFCSMMGQAILTSFEECHGVAEDQLEKLTYIPLEGEGTVDDRIEK